MKFSVLVAHYNNGAYFKDLYTSLKMQSFQDFEIIIVDDSSTDDSLSIIQKLIEGDDRVKLYFNECNKGVGYTKDRCIQLATGELCAFADPDDALVIDAIEKSIAQYSKNSQIIATYSQIQMCDNKLNHICVFGGTSEIKPFDLYFFNTNFEVSHFFTFKRSVYQQIENIDVSLESAEDQDLYLKLYEKGVFSYIKEPLYLYRQNRLGLSQDVNKKQRLSSNWNKVLRSCMIRRKIEFIDGFEVSKIQDLKTFLHCRDKKKSFLVRVLKKIKTWIS